jgi:tRNA(Ile)-lysidine synthase
MRLLKDQAIPFNEDPTNQDLRHDRNYLRHGVIPLMARRWPKYLKHYAFTSNTEALMLNVSVTNRLQGSRIFVFEQGAVIEGTHYSETQIQELIHHYSNTDRGELITPIQRMLKAIDNGKKGPFNFSGNVNAFHSYHLLMIYCRDLKTYDESIALTLGQLNQAELGQITTYKRVELKQAWDNLLKAPDAMLNMPGLVLVLESDSICKTLNTSVYHPLYPLVSQVCQQKGLRFITFTKCLELWWNKKDKLPEKLRLLPLCNLSNLFPSQAIAQSLII